MKENCNRCKALYIPAAGEPAGCMLGFRLDRKDSVPFPLEECSKPVTQEEFVMELCRRRNALHDKQVLAAINELCVSEPEAGTTPDGQAFTKEENAEAIGESISALKSLVKTPDAVSKATQAEAKYRLTRVIDKHQTRIFNSRQGNNHEAINHESIVQLAEFLMKYGFVVPTRCKGCDHSDVEGATGKRYCMLHCDREGEWKYVADDYFCADGIHTEKKKG